MIKISKIASQCVMILLIFNYNTLCSQDARKDYSDLKMVYEVKNKSTEITLNVAVKIEAKVINLTMKQAEKTAKSHFRGEMPLPGEIKNQLYKIAADSRTSQDDKVAALRAAGKIESDNRNTLSNLVDMEYEKLLKLNKKYIDYEVTASFNSAFFYGESMPKNKLASIMYGQKRVPIIEEHFNFREVPVAFGNFKGFKLNNNLIDNSPTIKIIKINGFPCEMKFNIKSLDSENVLSKKITTEIPNMIELTKNKLISETYLYNVIEKIDYGYYLVKINNDFRIIYVTPQEKIANYLIPSDYYLYIAGLWAENQSMSIPSVSKMELTFDVTGKIDEVKLFDKNGITPPKVQYIDEKERVDQLVKKLQNMTLVGPYKNITYVEKFKKILDFSIIDIEQYKNSKYAQSGAIEVENAPIPDMGLRNPRAFKSGKCDGLSRPGKVNVKGVMNVAPNGFGNLAPGEFQIKILGGNGNIKIIENWIKQFPMLFKPATSAGIAVSASINIDFTLENKVVDFHGMTKDELWITVNDIAKN